VRTYFRTVAVIAFVPVCLSVARAQDGTAGPVRGAFQSKLSALHIKGSHLVDALGAEKSLHGINLGGWLVTEAWMCGFNEQQAAAVAFRGDPHKTILRLGLGPRGPQR